MEFLKKGSRDQGFKGSSENNETLRQAQGDKKRVQGFEGPSAEVRSTEVQKGKSTKVRSFFLNSDLSLANIF